MEEGKEMEKAQRVWRKKNKMVLGGTKGMSDQKVVTGIGNQDEEENH